LPSVFNINSYISFKVPILLLWPFNVTLYCANLLITLFANDFELIRSHDVTAYHRLIPDARFSVGTARDFSRDF